jgi:hypothetical protein
VFQNVPLGGGSAGDARAVLATPPYAYNGAIGMLDATTPLAAYVNGAGFGQVRRYDGSGSLNSAANWTLPIDIGYVHHPRLAGGVSGLFMLASRQDSTIVARKWTGATFGAEVDVLGRADGDDTWLTQDAPGRLHALAASGRLDGFHLVHATSDGGASWRSGTVLVDAANPILKPRAAVAADHVGVAVWYTRIQSGPRAGVYEARVTAIGPEAPVDPPPPPPSGGDPPPPPPPQPPTARRRAGLPKASKPPATARRLSNGNVLVAVKGVIRRPAGISRALGCRGRVSVRFRRGRRAIGSKAITVNRSCAFRRKIVLARPKVKRARRLAMTVRFNGNAAVAPAKRTYQLPIKGRR